MNYLELNLPADFNERVRLFPLPKLVLFPGVVQGLHIFEPRYRELIQDSLETDQLITMATVLPDHGSNVLGEPQIADTVCIGKILNHSQLQDGRYNVFLLGVKRATIVNEVVTDKPYRVAAVDVFDEEQAETRLPGEYRVRLLEYFGRLSVQESKIEQELLDQLHNPDLPASRVIDMISFLAEIDPEDQLKVLETFDLVERAELVLDLLRRRVGTSGSPEFPPRFSLN